jgi:adenylate cyclase
MRLFEPLKQLVRNTEHVRDLHLDQVRRVPSRFREIETMDAAIWRMKQGLQSLEKFVPANLARQLIESDQEIRPGGEVRELALLFTGIAEMAALCARLPPERITALLTDELDRFTRVMLRLKGTIDNYLGESILAFWGAPVPVEDGAERACLAALECLRIEDELYADWDEPGLAPPRNLFSVHFGPSIVGAIGSRTRMTYTAVGDNVARGWEMRQLNHRYGTRIIVSSEVGRRVARRFWLRRLDALPLATDEGVSNAPQLELFELIDERSRPIEPARAELIERYEDALGRLLAGDWPTAEPLLEGLAARWPEDRAVQLMLERCRARDACWCPTDRAFHGTLLADVPGDSAAIGASRPTPGSPQRGDRGRTLG